MIHTNSESDVTSLDLSSPRSPKRPVYYVQSPSRDSHDEDKSSSLQTTPISNSPMDSPSHHSYSRSRASSASRVSGNFRSSSSGSKGRNKRSTEKGWRECNVIEEEGDYDEFYRGQGFSRSRQVFLAMAGFVVIFTVFCFILWCASTPYKAKIAVKSLNVHNFYYGEGSDYTGVPTKMLTMNCSVRMNVYNPATFFGIHVSSPGIKLMYSEITIATGQLEKYYQPRKSHRAVSANLQGNKIPLYGAGPSLAGLDNNGGVPMTLVFQVQSQGNVVGKLVKSRHQRHISCDLVIDSGSNKPINFKKKSCKYH